MQQTIMCFTMVTRCTHLSATSIQAQFILVARNRVIHRSEIQAPCLISSGHTRQILTAIVARTKSVITTQSTVLSPLMGFSLTTCLHLQKEMLEARQALMDRASSLHQLRHLPLFGHQKNPELIGRQLLHEPQRLTEQVFQWALHERPAHTRLQEECEVTRCRAVSLLCKPLRLSAQQKQW